MVTINVLGEYGRGRHNQWNCFTCTPQVRLTRSRIIWELFPQIVAQLEMGMKEGIPQSLGLAHIK